MKIYIRNRQRRIKVSQPEITRLLRKALSLLGLNRAELSVLLVNDRTMHVLNREYRGIDRTTDVLSFPQHAYISPDFAEGTTAPSPNGSPLDASGQILGDIVVNLHQAERQASEYGVAFSAELKRLLVHGLLHLIGYDHTGKRSSVMKMKKKEDSLLNIL